MTTSVVVPSAIASSVVAVQKTVSPTSGTASTVMVWLASRPPTLTSGRNWRPSEDGSRSSRKVSTVFEGELNLAITGAVRSTFTPISPVLAVTCVPRSVIVHSSVQLELLVSTIPSNVTWLSVTVPSAEARAAPQPYWSVALEPSSVSVVSQITDRVQSPLPTHSVESTLRIAPLVGVLNVTVASLSFFVTVTGLDAPSSAPIAAVATKTLAPVVSGTSVNVYAPVPVWVGVTPESLPLTVSATVSGSIDTPSESVTAMETVTVSPRVDVLCAGSTIVITGASLSSVITVSEVLLLPAVSVAVMLSVLRPGCSVTPLQATLS